MGADDQAGLLGDFAKDDLGQTHRGDARAGGGKRLQLFLVPVRPRQPPLPLLFDQDAVRDVVMGHDRIDRALMVETGGAQLEPALLGRRMAGIFEREAARAREHRADSRSRRARAGGVPSGGAVADVEVIDPNGRYLPGPVGLAEGAPGLIDSDNGAGLVEDGYRAREGVQDVLRGGTGTIPFCSDVRFIGLHP